MPNLQKLSKLHPADRAPDEAPAAKRARTAALAKAVSSGPSDRLFLGRLPLTVTAAALRSAFGADTVALIHWLADGRSGFFYGSAFAKMTSVSAATAVLERAGTKAGVAVLGKRIRVAFSQPKPGGAPWPPPGYVELPWPQIPI